MKLFFQKEKFQQRYFDWMKNLFQFEGKIKTFEVDFAKPWYQSLFNIKTSLIFTLFSEIAQAVFDAGLPLFVGYAISSQQFYIIGWVVTVYIFLEIVNRVVIYYWNIGVSRVQTSIMVASQTFFLTVDPISHSTKSSGQISSKLNATGRDFGSMLNRMAFDVLPVIVTYFAVTVTLAHFDSAIGIVAIISFILITGISAFLRYFNSQSLMKPFIKTRDKYIANQVENLQQNALIRSSFATVEQVSKMTKILVGSVAVRNIMSQGHSLASLIIRSLYIVSFGAIAYFVFGLIDTGKVDKILATTLLLTYLNGSSKILKIGDIVADVTESIGNITDLFDFINKFGKQTYPVLPSDSEKIAPL